MTTDDATHDIAEVKELVDAFHDDAIPVECLLDDHPLNDDYLRGIENLKRAIIRRSDTMRPHQVAAVKLRHQGYNNQAIAEKLGKKPASISSLLSNDRCKELLALLRYLSLALDGPADAQRRAMLWRIAEASEEDDPRCAISAIAELNRMHHNERQLQALLTQGVGSNRIEIVVSSPALARTTLDG